MRIMFRVINFIAFLFLISSNHSFAKETLPTEIAISNCGKVVFAHGKILVIGARARAIELPASLKRVLSTSSEVLFPEATSRRLDGKDVILMVVRVPSSNSPNGYCGAGSEDQLYAIELSGSSGKVVFSIKANSCLDNIELADDGVKPSFKSIMWEGSPARIYISWLRDHAGQARVHVYTKTKGFFVESSVNKQQE